MSKICPKCHEVYDNNDEMCGNCGAHLVNMEEKPNPALNLGDANAISGGVSINQSKNITSHDIHYHSTTIQEHSKSESELKLDAHNQLRSKAKEIMSERGRIDSVTMGQLRSLAMQLGIDEEAFKSIIKEVRSSRNVSNGGISAADARYLQQAQQAVQTNNMDVLSNLTARLEAMAAISQDDNVQYMHYLTLSLFYPLKCMEVFERQIDDNYWRSFWAIISYIRTGKHDDATKVLTTEFNPLRFEKSEEDRNLLEAYFNIMKEDKAGAQDFLDEILDEPSEQIKPLLRAVESSLYEEDAENTEVRFYLERVMAKSDVVVKTQKTAEASISVEESSKKVSEQKAGKDNKEADELYAKASAASGAKRVMLLQKAAEAGSLEAMYDLGDCYYDGEGVDKNMPLAIKWMTKASDAGYTLAQAALGGTYFTGAEGLDQNYALSEKYLLMAAEKGNTDAQAGLAALYVEMEEYDKALKWARKAAQASNSLAYFILGRIYDEGLGVEVNNKEGLKWFEEAAKYGDAAAQNVCGNIYLNADYVEHDPEKAFKYYQMAAAQGHLWGMCNLGCCYQDGLGTEKNIQTAKEWLQKAANGGLEDAQTMLDGIYDVNTSQPLDENAEMERALDAYNNDDYETASGIWKRWAEKGNVYAMAYFGDCCRDGEGVPQDFNEAARWYRKAADLGNDYAMAYLGDCYLNGNGVTQNHKEATKWYKKAGELGNAYAFMCLADLSESPVKAVKWWLKAAELGHAEACRNLGVYYESTDIKEAVKWCQKALDNGYEDEDGEIKSIIKKASTLPAPQVIFEKAWVTQENDQCIGVHFSLRVIGQKGKMMTFKFNTSAIAPRSTKDSSGSVATGSLRDKATLDETQWGNVWFTLTVGESDGNLIYSPRIDLNSELSVYSSDKQCLGKYFIRYVVNHEAHVIRRDKLIVLKVDSQGNRGISIS